VLTLKLKRRRNTPDPWYEALVAMPYCGVPVFRGQDSFWTFYVLDGPEPSRQAPRAAIRPQCGQFSRQMLTSYKDRVRSQTFWKAWPVLAHEGILINPMKASIDQVKFVSVEQL
jgi:hypothetical protein